MIKNNILIGILIGLVIFSCSSNDDNGNLANGNQNGFNFNGNFYSTQNAFVDDEPDYISINLSNINPYQPTQTTGINFVNIEFLGTSIETGTITDITNYRIVENAEYLDDSFIALGTTIINRIQDGFTITSGTVTINFISETNIDFTFTFTREDGEIVNGSYSGVYTNTSE
ncbi:hypothetical protein [Psychroserpens damuponensis]|uniref:hypothetical protein n=1 Tax=Psychroserpens damuponensis TaxID=943936 RepID=UPI00058B7B1C|nr:hypothetical protein [Psychroserpens damuponensis]